jgi:menaquinone-specific isochorismate synthase
MKVYWSDRERNPPPRGALFHCIPFSSNHFTKFNTPSQFISHLPPPIYNLEVKNHLYLPTYNEWLQNVEVALSSGIEKVVLARCHILELNEAPDPFAIAATLEKKAKGAFVFCFQEGSSAFVGASPERLLFRKKNRLITEAMAGTLPRGKTKEEDELLQQKLLLSKKYLREILPVQKFLRERLSPLCIEDPIFSPITVHQTHTVQHLYSKGVAELKENISDSQILQAIHPTPALCGMPQKEALALIQRLEPFERGLYGGALGWSYQDSSEWIVGIRSCLIQENKIYLFSGAGIVQGSQSTDEWSELNSKLKVFDEVFLSEHHTPL